MRGRPACAVDGKGDLFIADTGNNRVREVTRDGTITTVSGTGVAGLIGDGGPASLASLDQPTGLAVDGMGDLFIADTANNRVREIAGGRIATIAGSGFSGFGGDGGPAARASLDGPTGLAIDAQGDLYIADTANNRVREVLSSGVMITVAGNGQMGPGGNDEQSNVAQLDHPSGVVIDGDGDLFIADTGNGAIRAVNPEGIISVVGLIGGQTPVGEGQGPSVPSKSPGMGLSLIAGDSFGNVFASDTAGQAVHVASDPDDSIIGPAKVELDTSDDDEIGLTSQLLPLARTSLELAATLVIVSIEGRGGRRVGLAAEPASRPANRAGSILRIDLTSEETETGDPYAPSVPSPLLEYLLGLNVSFAEGSRIITSPSNNAGAAARPATDRPAGPAPGPLQDDPEVPPAPAEPAPEGPTAPASDEGTVDQAFLRPIDRDRDSDRSVRPTSVTPRPTTSGGLVRADPARSGDPRSRKWGRLDAQGLDPGPDLVDGKARPGRDCPGRGPAPDPRWASPGLRGKRVLTMKPRHRSRLLTFVLLTLGLGGGSEGADEADLILFHGKVVTVDRGFSVREALAVKGDRLLRVGTDEEVLQTRGPGTTMIDLGGKMVLPGLIDSHTHPSWASLTEFDHPIPEMETIGDVLAYIGARAEALGPGQWVVVRQVFITRLAERRYPTRDELDRAAPRNPVLFSTGPDASLNSMALKLSGIDRDFRPEGPGKVEKDPKTGEPTGILRNLTRYVKVTEPGSKPSERDEERRLVELFRDYNSVGLTAVIDRSADVPAVDRYTRLHAAGALTVRLGISRHIETQGPLEPILDEIRKVAEHPLRRGGPRLRIVGIKTFLDGGMLTGSAYMSEPWGVSRIYAIDDPNYRGVLFIPPDRLVAMVQEAVDSGLQFTAHSVGDGAVNALLDAYEEVNKKTPVATTRPCLTHSNFMSRQAIAKAARLGVVADLQPAWLYLDAKTLSAQFGNDRLRYFQPLHSLFEAGVIAGGGSDHMQKIGSFRSINPYNPFLGMSVAITRRAKGLDAPLHPEEALTREQAIRFYTINNAHLLFLEDRIGSLEVGKQADFVVLDRDLLTCPEAEIRETQVLATYLDGKRVFERRN